MAGLIMKLCFLPWGMILINRITLEPAFVLHTRPYQETSIIVDLFTRSFGRINAIAKGAKRPKSPLRSLLTPASKLSISLTGKNELKTFSSAEIISHYDVREGSAFNTIIYVNELVAKATEKEDPHVHIFDEYEKLLANITDKTNQYNLEKLLRGFELRLLQEMGYGIDLTRDAETNQKITGSGNYEFHPEKGFILRREQSASSKLYAGKDINSFADGDFEKKTTRDISKSIMRKALDYHLGNKTLNIRKYLTKK